MSEEGEYRPYVLAYLKHLKYLDYAMVVQSEVAAAREQYQDELIDVEEKEALEEVGPQAQPFARRHVLLYFFTFVHHTSLGVG